MVSIWVSSDGDPQNTTVATEHGTIEFVSRLDITVEPGDLPRVNIEVLGTPLHIEGILASVCFVCPGCLQPVPHECDGP